MYTQPDNPLTAVGTANGAGAGGCPASPTRQSDVYKPGASNRPQQLMEVACKAVRASQGFLAVFSAEQVLVDLLTWGVPTATAAELRRSPWLEQLLRALGQRPQPLRLEDLADAGADLAGSGDLPGAGPFLAVPLACAGRSRGVLCLARPHGQAPFDADDDDTLQTLRGWLEQGNLFEESRLLAQLQLLNQVAQAAAGNHDLTRIVAVALRALDRYLPLHVFAVWLTENVRSESVERGAWPGEREEQRSPARDPRSTLVLIDTNTAAGSRAQALGLEPGQRLAVGQTPFAPCLERAEAVYTDLELPDQKNTALAAQLAERGATSCFAVPLRAGEQVAGVLHGVCTRPGGFTRDQIQLLYLVADLLGPAVSNCQMFGRLRGAYEELRLTQGQLIRAEKMRALGELAGGMAHEFNNALCGVLGFLEISLLNHHLDAGCRGHLNAARTCALDAAETVRRVQDFARQRRDELTVQTVDVNELVREVVELTRHRWESPAQARGKPVAVRLDTRAVAAVSGCPAELREVLTNLIFNAADAMPDGGTLTVRAWSTAPEVVLEVQDNGVGMSEAVQKRLFEPFFTTKGERGNGLGLSVVFGIVRRHNGSIAVVSQPGQGATFTVRLPAAAESAPAEPRRDVPAAPAASRGAGLRVLVVEDDASIRSFLKVALTQLGHRPHVTADAEEGLAAFAAGRYDVVLTDLGLPGASGEEVARQVARRDPGTPVVLLTGWADQLQADGRRPEGVACLLGKPVTIDNLAAALQNVGGRR